MQNPYFRWTVIIAVGFLILAAWLVYQSVKPLSFDSEVWQEASPSTKGRMVHDLLDRFDFTGYSRGELYALLGFPDLDERLYWYHLGETDAPHARSSRVPVGDSSQFVIMFRADIQNIIDEVRLDRRPSKMENAKFDETVWRIATPKERGRMVKNLVSRVRWIGRPVRELEERLGPPDGELFRAHYSVGNAGKLFSFGYALIFTFNEEGEVTEYRLE